MVVKTYAIRHDSVVPGVLTTTPGVGVTYRTERGQIKTFLLYDDISERKVETDIHQLSLHRKSLNDNILRVDLCDIEQLSSSVVAYVLATLLSPLDTPDIIEIIVDVSHSENIVDISALVLNTPVMEIAA